MKNRLIRTFSHINEEEKSKLKCFFIYTHRQKRKAKALTLLNTPRIKNIYSLNARYIYISFSCCVCLLLCAKKKLQCVIVTYIKIFCSVKRRTFIFLCVRICFIVLFWFSFLINFRHTYSVFKKPYVDFFFNFI